ncbi:MAG TPA: hypothetical protein VEB65_03815, partial [Solirubrobacterales bacterium]|nr:hypothetical protein [Solirubrobacterales bacterium]
DGSIDLSNAVGAAGQTYLQIPPAGGGHGLVQVPVQGRTVELRAVTPEGSPIPTGAPVIVVAVVDGETVEVVPTPTL